MNKEKTIVCGWVRCEKSVNIDWSTFTPEIPGCNIVTKKAGRKWTVEVCKKYITQYDGCNNNIQKINMGKQFGLSTLSSLYNRYSLCKKVLSQ